MTAASLADILGALDPEQHSVATAPRGPVCVLAGAGTGKTRALTHRIAALVASDQVDPREVLALTFTARAAGELRGRLRTLGVDGVQARTFHAAALRQLRYFWPSVVGGASPNILPAKAPLISEAASRLRVRADGTVIRDIAAEIEWAKVSQVTPESYPARSRSQARGGVSDLDAEVVARVYAGYETVKRDRGFIDFEDVLLLTAGMIEDDAAMATAVRDQYRSLLVDEYQDVSPIQQRLLDLWLADRDDLTVVGDANQTIYSFAGATPSYLLGFRKRFPTAAVIRLERSYRSTPQVVATANRLLASSPATDPAARVVLKAQRPSGSEPEWVVAADEAAEVTAVVQRIRALVDSGVEQREVAILYRINAQSAAYEEALTEAKLPYTVRGGERFFDRKEVREAVALLRGAAHADGTTTPGGLADQVGAVLGSVGYRPSPPPGPSKARDRWESWAAIVEVARQIQLRAEDANLGDLVEELQHRANTQHAPASDGVTLSSLHAAKGLEWDAVFLVGLTEGMMPITYATTPDQVAEERRLLYVGITRARSHLAFSYGRSRSPGDRRTRAPSPFLATLDTGFTTDEARPSGRSSRTARPASCRRCGRALTTAAERKLRHCSHCEVHVDLVLFEQLREWRKQTADAASVPAFVVFTDATLTAIAADRPTTATGLLQIPGIGQVKVDRYGEALLGVLRASSSDSPE
ncbi:MAG: ATP-dependent DNA helicase UvrD2 [Actinomycetia bacterium]|nr:ATP-dependent DNA helicase UvrD2 [Actinomycetes bacterium]